MGLKTILNTSYIGIYLLIKKLHDKNHILYSCLRLILTLDKVNYVSKISK